MNRIKSTYLLAGNQALRQKDFSRSIQCYMQALQGQSGLEQTLIANLAYARLKYLQQESKSDRACNTTIIADCLETTPVVSRVRAIAALLTGEKKTGSGQITLFSTQHNSLLASSEGLRLVSFSHDFPSSIPDENLLHVANNPADRVFLCNPNAANVALGVAYKLVWGAQVIVDLSGSHNFSDCLPKLAYEFDLITTPDSDLRLSFGGHLLNEVTDLNSLPAQMLDDQICSQPLIDFSMCQGGLWRTTSEASGSLAAH